MRGRPRVFATKPIAAMSKQELAAYHSASQRRARERKSVGRPNRGPRPAIWACRDCGEEKEFTEENFYRLGSFWGLALRCKRCAVLASSDWAFRKKYGLTAAQYREIMAGASCVICGSASSLVLDHCHESGTVRSVLCSACNTSIGAMAEDPIRLRRAAVYCEVYHAARLGA